MEEKVTVQQLPGQVGAPLAALTVFNPEANRFELVTVKALEVAVLGEKVHALDKIDVRNGKIEVTLGAGAAVDSSGRKSLEVPSGEVWYLNRVELYAPSPGAAGDYLAVNFRVSHWPDPAADPDGKAYLPTPVEPKGTTVTVGFKADGELGEELRLPGGSKLTLVATVRGAALAADTTASLTAYGRKGKRVL